jgi:Ni/Fe-hydrogenase subunit HybB-like protein
MVVVESMAAARSLGRKPEMHLLTPLSRIIPILLFIYLAVKVSDLAIRDAWEHLGDSRVAGWFAVEMLLGVVTPLAILLFERARRSPRLLFLASFLVVAGVALNRVNVFITAYQPFYATWRYVPSPAEIAVTVGLASGLILVYRTAVFLFPVLPAEEPAEEAGESASAAAGEPSRARESLAGVAR